MTITVREKGKTLEQSGGLVMTSDMWLAPRIAAMKEIADFDLRYAQKLYGPMIAGASPQDMAAAMAMYPMMKQAMEKWAAEGGSSKAPPILTTVTMEAVKSAEQMAQETKTAAEERSLSAPPASVGGLIGGLAKRKIATEEGRRSDGASRRAPRS